MSRYDTVLCLFFAAMALYMGTKGHEAWAAADLTIAMLIARTSKTPNPKT